MKKYYCSNNFYSNCLIVALIAKFRYGGNLKFNIQFSPIGVHFFIQKNKYILDFTPAYYNPNIGFLNKLFFYGNLRVRRVKNDKNIIWRSKKHKKRAIS